MGVVRMRALYCQASASWNWGEALIFVDVFVGCGGAARYTFGGISAISTQDQLWECKYSSKWRVNDMVLGALDRLQMYNCFTRRLKRREGETCMIYYIPWGRFRAAEDQLVYV